MEEIGLYILLSVLGILTVLICIGMWNDGSHCGKGMTDEEIDAFLKELEKEEGEGTSRKKAP